VNGQIARDQSQKHNTRLENSAQTREAHQREKKTIRENIRGKKERGWCLKEGVWEKSDGVGQVSLPTSKAIRNYNLAGKSGSEQHGRKGKVQFLGGVIPKEDKKQDIRIGLSIGKL